MCVVRWGHHEEGRFGAPFFFIHLSIYGGQSVDACLLKRDQQ